MEPYQRQQGDYEIRILPDGRLVMLAPDEELILMAEDVENQRIHQVIINQNKEADNAAE